MARGSYHVEGLSELKGGLEELTKATAINVLKRALMKAGEPIQSDAQARAPRAKGKRRNRALHTRIFVSGTLTGRQRKQHRKQSPAEVFVGVGGVRHEIEQEFGTAQHGPQPFMRPAWDSNKMTAFDSFKDDLAQEIEKARQRAAKKAARVLARMKKG